MAIPNNPKKAKELKVKAEQAFVDAKWKKSLDLYRDLDREMPEDVRVLQRIADLSKRLGKTDEAIDGYKKVAKLFAHQGFWAKALAVNKVILELDPSDLEVQRQLAKMYASQEGRGIKSEKAKEEPKETPFAKAVEERVAVSLAGESPRTMDQPPDLELESALGGTLTLENTDALELAEEITAPEQVLGAPRAGLRGIPLFSDMSVDEVTAVLDRLAHRKFPKDAFICEEGDLGRSMFIIAEGIVEVFNKRGDGARIVLGRLCGGDFFGEFGLLTNGVRKASVQAMTQVEALEISAADFDSIAARHPRVWTVLEEYVRRRMLSNILTKSPVFQVLTDEEKGKLVQVLANRKARAGEVLMPQGTAGDEMFFIRSGTVAVTVQKESGQKILVGELEAGDYFGEVAMLTGKPRTATVTARSDCDLLRLSRKDAAQILKSNREVLMRLKGKMDSRTQETAEAYRSYLEARTTLNLV